MLYWHNQRPLNELDIFTERRNRKRYNDISSDQMSMQYRDLVVLMDQSELRCHMLELYLLSLIRSLPPTRHTRIRGKGNSNTMVHRIEVCQRKTFGARVLSLLYNLLSCPASHVMSAVERRQWPEVGLFETSQRSEIESLSGDARGLLGWLNF